MDKSFRIRTEVGKDKVVHVNLQQDYSFLEILSLKINQIDSYKLHVSNYGILVGRVVANGNFGIPNAKVSVFIPLNEDDSLLSEIKNLYPYESTSDKDSEGRRYNLLQDSSNDDCYRIVGSFPNKRLVLDNDTYIEIFDKYYKYTTVTNKSGDYMIPFVPCGGQEVHTDLDLSDIGILSQRPIDMMYKGYNETQFDNARQFKEGTNLNNLTQIISQNNSVHIYPFWGDSNLEEIAISRCDIEVQYKFEPTCVFFGSIISDNFNNAIGHKCSPSKYSGFNRNLVTGEGTIEMIRKTPDNLVEEFQIQGNRLIDGDGVWCYQIPMNLDYVGTDEYGNIVPTDNPNKGIPTRTSVRFRVSMQETNNEGVSRHRAKYLIPNVQDIIVDGDHKPQISGASQFDKCYEFGSATPDEYFRDLYWNKVYSVKNYIPRLQTNSKKNNQNYSAIKSVNSNNNLNPVPFNHARYRLVFAYRVLCMIMTIVIYIICFLNTFFSALACFCLPRLPIIGKICPFKPLAPGCFGFSGGLTEDEDNNNEYFPCCLKCGKMSCDTPGCTKVTDKEELINTVQQTLSQEYDTVNLDFYNDWLNGSLYLPLWFWRKTKKKKYFFGLFSKKAVNSFCSCGKNFPKLRVTENCSLPYDDDFNYSGDLKGEKYHNHYPDEKTFTFFGVIKEFVNKAGLNIYYYAPGIPNDVGYRNGFEEGDDKTSYVRLYSTDIILLGSLNSCDLDNYPSVYANLPSTTANVPFIATVKQSTQQEEDATYLEDAAEEKGYVEVTGMDWLHEGEDGKPKYGAGLFIDLACNAVYTKPKSCINVQRMSELGVGSDMYVEEYYSANNKLETNIILADGMITRYEINDHESRAIFASLNNNGLKEKVYNPNTGYETYKLRYVYPNDFDGHLDSSAKNYTNMMDFKTYDNRNQDYIDYRFGLGTYNAPNLIPYYSKKDSNYRFPLFNNSFYFYFGLNEGKTAIDKFNNKFNAVCYKNEKYPFTFDISTTPSEWCIDSGCTDNNCSEYATIIVTFNTIKTPYSYTLYNEFNEELISEDGIMLNELKFGYYVGENGEYIDKKDGRLQYLNFDNYNERFVLNENGENVLLENGTYTLEIIDVNGNKGTQKIVIDQVPISISFETVALGNKYYADGENKSIVTDFCNTNEYFGELKITEIIIDGISYYVTNCGGSGNNYELNVTNDKGLTKQVELEINPTEEKFNNFQTECTCNGTNGYMYAEIRKEGEHNVLVFNIWIPQNYDITVTEVCPTNPIPNTTKVTASILNGEPFNVYLNDVPLRLIVGKNEEPAKYNGLLYNSGTPRKNINELINFWNKINNESSYEMPLVDIKNKDVWSDFVTVTTELNDDNIEQLTEDAKMNILEYKYESIFNMCKTCYVVDDGESLMQLSYSGGKKPYLKRGVYPQYDEITEHNEILTYLYDCDGYVTCEASHPNIIGFNYTTPYHDSDRFAHSYSDKYHNNYDYPRNVLNYRGKGVDKDFNQMILFGDYKNQGNYFAAFTKNGGYEEKIANDGTKTCSYNRNEKYQQYPYSATPQIDSLECYSGSSVEDYIDSKLYQVKSNSRPYFRGLFIDKRYDYSVFMYVPYNGNDMASMDDGSNNNADRWRKGIIDCKFYNGIAMSYDSSYNIIGNGLEYTSKMNDYSTELNYGNKRYYKADLKLDNKVTDIRSSIDYGDETSYPTLRKYKNSELPSCNKMELTIASCSYNVEMGIEDDGENQYVTAITESIGETSFEVDCRNMVNVQLPSLEECAANDTFNCRFNEWLNGKLYATRFGIDFKLKQDSENTTHSIYTYKPMLLLVKRRGNNTNTLNLIYDKIKSGDIQGITEYTKNESYCKYIGANKETDDNIRESDWKPNIGRFLYSNMFNKINHYRLKDEESRSIAFDNVTEIKNIVYSIKNFKLNNIDILSICLFRNYLNMSNDGLTKEISTFQVTSLFDVRGIRIKCTEAKEIELNNTETETTTDGTVTVTTSSTETDSEGETTITTGNSTSDIDATSSSTSKTKVQYTQYQITWAIGDANENQQFINSDKMTAMFKVDGKITSNINITSDETSATFDVYWNGDLEDTFLKNDTKRCKLFIQMPNKLVYLLDFKQNGKTISGT